MAHPDLTSHHVNYLIWRYLQESGHGEAAVMLQRAWFRDPQSLPFAPYIKAHALVSLVQKGLQYHDLEQSLDKEGNPIPTSPSKYFFGPEPLEIEKLNAQVDPSEAGLGIEPAAAPASPISKVAQDGAAINGHLTTEITAPAIKKTRKGDRGSTNGDINVPMDVDSNGVANSEKRSQSPAEVDGDGDVSMGVQPETQDQEPAAAPTFTLTSGQSVGVQITPTKAADLSPNTAILDVAGDDHVTRTIWRPHDSTVFVASGDSFCSLWKLSPSAAPVQERLFGSSGDNTLVTTVAWEPTGQKLAVATYNDMRGSITMYDVHGNAVDLLPEVPRMISGLYWADHGSHLIVVASDSKVSELALWDDSIRPDEFPSPQIIEDSIYDLTWAGRNQTYACGDGAVYQCDIDSSIHLTRTFSSGGADTAWTFIRSADAGDSSVVVTASSATSEFWIPTHDIHLKDAHQAEISGIELRSQPQTSGPPQIVLASTSTDDTVKIWHVDLESKRFECIHRLFLGPSVPALAGSFSPDGYAFAAASKDKLFIWNAERGGNAMATWTKPGSEEPKTEESPEQAVINGHNGAGDPMPDRSLSWDTDGKKLAIGFGTQMAIVNLQR